MCAVLLYTGLPQRKAAEWAAARILGARFQVEGLQVLGRLRAQEIVVGGPGAAPPVVRVEDLDVQYALFPSPRRFLSSAYAGPVEITLQNTGPGDTNYGFLQAVLTKPRGGGQGISLEFVPRQFGAGPISLNAAMPDFGLELAGMRLSGEAPDGGPIRVQLNGTDLTGRGWTTRIAGADAAFANGSADIRVAAAEGGFTLERLYLQLPGLAEANAVGRVLRQNGDTRVELDIDRLEGHGPYLAGLLAPMLGVPVSFDGLHAEDTQVFGSYGPSGLHGLYINADAAIRDMALGPPQTPWFKGGLALRGHMEDNGGALTATFNQGPSLQATLEGALPEATVKARIEQWSRKDLAALIPNAWRARFDPGPDARIQASVRAALGQGQATVDMEAACAHAAPFGYALPDGGALSVNGTALLSEGFSKITLKNLALTWPNAKWRLAGGPLQRAPFQFESPFTGSFNVSALPKGLLDYPVHGSANIKGQAQFAAKQIRVSLNATASSLGYGSFDASPLIPSVDLNASLSYSPGGKAIDIKGLRAAWDADSRIEAQPFQVTLSPLAWSAPFTLQSDWAPIARLLPLEITGGAVQGAGTCLKDPAGTRIKLTELRAQWDTGVYDKGLVRTTGLEVAAREPCVLGSILTGGGTIALASATAAKATLTQLQGTWRLEDGDVVLDDLAGVLFNGAISASGRMGLLKDNLPGSLHATFKALDLARLTQEVQPSDVKLEGMVDGDATADWSTQGLHNLELHLVAPEGLRVNRDFLEWLLMSQYMASESMSDRTIRAVRESVLGGDAMRPFKRAEARLKLEEGEFRGPLSLESDALSLTIELSMDQASLMDIFEIGKLAADSGGTDVQWGSGAQEAPSE